MINFKWRGLSLIFISGALLLRMAWPTEIVAVHASKSGYAFRVIIKTPPFTEQGKIGWWIENKKYFKDNYNVPIGEKDYSISFWVSDYKVMPDTDQGSDLLCFDDIEPPKNCIEKDNNPLTVLYIHDNNLMIISLDNDSTHWLRDDLTGRMRKVDI